MRYNGTLKGVVRQDAGVDEYGEPIAGVTAFSDPVPCAVNPTQDNRRGVYEDGEFHQAAYTVILEERDLKYSRILLEMDGEQLGEFRVLSRRKLPGQGRIQLLV